MKVNRTETNWFKSEIVKLLTLNKELTFSNRRALICNKNEKKEVSYCQKKFKHLKTFIKRNTLKFKPSSTISKQTKENVINFHSNAINKSMKVKNSYCSLMVIWILSNTDLHKNSKDCKRRLLNKIKWSSSLTLMLSCLNKSTSMS